jgi:hypothetical protein
MTLQEFEQFKIGIESDKSCPSLGGPLHQQIEHEQTEKIKLQRLIELGKDVRSKTVQLKVEGWKRRLKRIESSIDRLERLKTEIAASNLKVSPPDSNTVIPGFRRIRVE